MLIEITGRFHEEIDGKAMTMINFFWDNRIWNEP